MTDEAQRNWILPRLRPTPICHFTEPVKLSTKAGRRPPRAYVRCRDWSNPIFDRYAAQGGALPGWTTHDLASNHLPYVTHPRELANLLVGIAG